MKTYLRLLNFIGEIKVEITNKTLLALLMTATYLVQAVCMARVVDAVFASAGFREIVGYLVIVTVAILLRSYIAKINETYTKTMAERIKGRLRKECMEAFLLNSPVME